MDTSNPINEKSVSAMLKKVAEAAGIKKNIEPIHCERRLVITSLEKRLIVAIL